ncbi:hypothetical protein ABE61_03835 [Lysinibacillus sphaericus]|nr:hypothetical protein [Lysinibacillus sphaericus]MBG9476080.1 hypothetical protein [Lysinibacillus sphaericus]MBG9591929.1 hypothetical protein [Lysinibacillus sphaericus]
MRQAYSNIKMRSAFITKKLTNIILISKTFAYYMNESNIYIYIWLQTYNILTAAKNDFQMFSNFWFK